MRKFVYTLVLAMLSSVAVAQTNLSEIKQKDREAYLERVSKKVVKHFGEDGMENCQICKISGPIEFTEKDLGPDEKFKKYYGKKYYLVSYTTEKRAYDYVRVKIWEHDGKPLSIYFVDAIAFHFLNTSFDEFVKKYPTEIFQPQK